MHRWDIRRRRGDGGPGRPGARFAISAVFVGGIAMLVLSCGDGTVGPPPPPAPVATTVTVSPGSAALSALGETARFTAEVRDQNGQVMAGAVVAWASSDASVALVDASGLVTAAANGSATITATAGSASGTAAVTVEQSVASVELSVSAHTILLGSSLQLNAEAFDGNGHVVTGAAFTWESSDDAVATVDESGRVTAVGEGEATVTATAGEAHGTAMVTVEESPDRAALVALYEATDGPNWFNNKNWLSDAPLGEWYGVETDGLGRVMHIDLASRWDEDAGQWAVQGLSGPIPPELGQLTHLTRLDLFRNDLSGSIPTEVVNLANLTHLDLGNNDLTGPIPPELGNLLHLKTLRLFNNSLDGPIPPELGNLLRLWDLNVSGNRLAGPVPPELGDLTDLGFLRLGGNTALAGPLPTTLTGLTALRKLVFEETGLCAPHIESFRAWLRGVDEVRGEFCAGVDLAVLRSLYEATGGTGWTESGGWLGDDALDEWYGVTTDSTGRVVALDLSRNGLAGELPRDLGDLDRMIELRIGGNALTGPLPLSLVRLSLRELRYANTELCAPAGESFRAWLNAIAHLEGTGVQCAPPPDRDILEALYEATDGPRWGNNEKWLTDAPLTDWYGVEVDEHGLVVGLRVLGNNLAGPIPPELGNLANLRTLHLRDNNLAGPIPAELGNLANLRTLNLGGNNLVGPIPAALGNLANLRTLNLGSNNLAGPIPAELGNLSSLVELYLRVNDLTGPIPAELGNLSRLVELDLGINDLDGPMPPELGNLSRLVTLYLRASNLTGPIPAELGNLSSLVELDLVGNNLTGPAPPELGNLSNAELLMLAGNQLSGSVPAGFGGLASLRQLQLGNNAAMAGPLPTGLTALGQLDGLLAGGTSLCAPTDSGFQRWLEGVRTRRIAPCTEADAPAAYLVQAAQSRKFPVPLVAGERALLRVFPTAQRATGEGIPAVRARFYRDDRETHVAVIPGKSTPIPTNVDEGSLARSANTEIPGHVIQPGLEMVIEVDPDGTLDQGLGVARRIPDTGRLAVEVARMPLFDLTVVPFLWRSAPDSAVLRITRAMASDPENHELLVPTFTVLPVGDLQVRLHEPVLTRNNAAGPLHRETVAIRAMDGGAGHYLGTMTGRFSGPIGEGGGNRVSIATIDGPYTAGVIAHEIGHNMSLDHPPPNSPNYAARDGLHVTDYSYPYADGAIGVWGYDFRSGGTLVRPTTRDVMGSINGYWISDYHFTNALRYRLADESAPTASTSAAAKSLLLWGGTDSDGVPILEPAFVVEAPPTLPDSAGAYEVTGRTADGSTLFSLSFAMPEVADGDGSSSFAFVVPTPSGWQGNLASITLLGPGGSVTLDGESDLAMAILRNPRTGQVRAILRDPPPATQTAADAVGQGVGAGLDVLFSRGVPNAAAWHR